MLGMTRRRGSRVALGGPPSWGEVHFDPSLHTAGELVGTKDGEPGRSGDPSAAQGEESQSR